MDSNECSKITFVSFSCNKSLHFVFPLKFASEKVGSGRWHQRINLCATSNNDLLLEGNNKECQRATTPSSGYSTSFQSEMFLWNMLTCPTSRPPITRTTRPPLPGLKYFGFPWRK